MNELENVWSGRGLSNDTSFVVAKKILITIFIVSTSIFLFLLVIKKMPILTSLFYGYIVTWVAFILVFFIFGLIWALILKIRKIK